VDRAEGKRDSSDRCATVSTAYSYSAPPDFIKLKRTPGGSCASREGSVQSAVDDVVESGGKF
jgi:hypothetical protein